MQNEKRHLEELFQKYQEGLVTEEEKEIIARWLVHLDVNENVLTEDQLAAKQQLSQQALKKILVASKNPPASIRRLPIWVRTIAAMLLLTAGLFIYLNPQKKQLVVKQLASTHDLLPGSSKAILTLSNGSKINLNAAKNGILARQGNTAIHKLINGKVAYSADDVTQPEQATAAVQFNTISTPRGGQYFVWLPDGTKVWLNAASSIHFPTEFNGNERIVEITGEAYFEVTKNKEKPFSVICANQKLTVLGTHFNINAYPEEGEIKTTLLEGSVNVSNGVSGVVLKPGQQSKINLENVSAKILVSSDVDLDEVVAWKNGFFQFNKADIRMIMNQISRWYDVDVEIAGKLPADHYRGKMPRNVSASKVLKILELSGIHFTVEGRKIIVKP